MNLHRIFSYKAEKILGRELADRLGRDLPPKLMAERRQVLSANKVSRLLEQVFDVAKDHQAKHGLGFVGRAVLANSFKWELDAKGYPKDFIDVATEGLIVELSRASGAVKRSVVS